MDFAPDKTLIGEKQETIILFINDGRGTYSNWPRSLDGMFDSKETNERGDYVALNCVANDSVILYNTAK